MKRKRHTAEEIIKKLRAAGEPLAAARHQRGDLPTLEKPGWRHENRPLLKRLKELEKENGRLQRAVANLTLDKAILKEIAEGKW